MARVQIFNLTHRCPCSQKTFLCCRLGSCHLRLCLLEKVTLQALLRLVPVRSQTFLAVTTTLAGRTAAAGATLRRGAATLLPEKQLREELSILEAILRVDKVRRRISNRERLLLVRP